MSAAENKAFVRQWVEDVWNGGKLARIDEVIAPDYVMRSPGAPDVTGPEGFRHYVTMYRAALPDLHMVIEDMVAEGDKVAWRVATQGHQTGPLMALPPTGRSATVAVTIISRLANGRWAEDWVLVDMFGMLQQLGAIPAPAGSGV
jgi:predicted ester cyclase